ncbi:anti-sigma factor family protein [Cohnella caldifontis]|uniref:anti-sigma factor family protein n=1 Tax=Cohnella caldifontis TaxID=3027471 RepID=UPI0023ED6C5D|nr:zf-HC2 domain-containing protein [Cohnella sp. YIM B05605]
MNCQEGMELMQRHVDGDLNDEETSRLMDHVGHCPDCAAMLERLVRLSRGLEQLPRVVPPYSLVDAILPQLEQWDTTSGEGETSAAAPLEPRSRRAGRARRSWIYRVSGVVVAGVVVGLLLVNGPYGRMGGSQQDAASSGAEMKRQADAPMASMGVQDQYGAASPAPESSASTFGIMADTSEGGKAKEKSAASGEATDGDASSSDAGVQAPKAPPAGSGGSGTEAGPVEGLSIQGTADATSRDAAKNGSGQGSADNGPVQGFTGGGGAQGFAGNDPSQDDAADSANALDASQMSIAGEQPATEEALSPNGEWRAAITGGKLQIYRQGDGKLVYDQTPDEGTRSGLSWSDDSTTVYYTFSDADGNQTDMELIIDPSGFQEIRR